MLADPNVPDEQAGRLVRQRVGMARLTAARRPTEDRGQRDHGHFDLLAAGYKYLRTFTPVVIAALPLTGNTTSPTVTALLTAVEVLRELNAAGRTAVPDEATTAKATVFVPARRPGYLDATRGQGRGAAYRHYWELGVLYGVQAGLRSGDLWVPGSRRYTDPSTLLLPPERWAGQRDDFCTITGTDPNPSRQLERLDAELHAAVAGLETILADPGTEGLARLGDDGELIVSPLPAEQVPAEADSLAEATSARLPQGAVAGAADRGRPADRVQRGVHPRRRCPATQPRTAPQPVRVADHVRLQPRLRRNGRRLRHLRRRPGLDLTVVPAPRHTAGSQHPAGQRPPRAPAREAVGRRDAVILRRAEVPAARPQPDRPRTVAVLPR